MIERTLLFDRVANEKEQTAGLPNLGSKLKKSWEPSVGLNTRLNIVSIAVKLKNDTYSVNISEYI